MAWIGVFSGAVKNPPPAEGWIKKIDCIFVRSPDRIEALNKFTMDEFFKAMSLNKNYFAKKLGVSRSYFTELIRKDGGKYKVELRTHLRNYATEILNFLEK